MTNSEVCCYQSENSDPFSNPIEIKPANPRKRFEFPSNVNVHRVNNETEEKLWASHLLTRQEYDNENPDKGLHLSYSEQKPSMIFFSSENILCSFNFLSKIEHPWNVSDNRECKHDVDNK